MYKFFLCLRYLRSKVLAYFAIIGVAVCVWMMVTAVSVMSGFLEQIEAAAKGLFGDIVMESGGERGIAWYDEFMAGLESGPFNIEGSLSGSKQVSAVGTSLPVYDFRGTLGPAMLERLAGKELFRDKAVTILPASGTMRFDGGSPRRVEGLLRVGRDGKAVFHPTPSQDQLDVFRTLGRLSGQDKLATTSLDELRADLAGPVSGVEAAGPFMLSFGMIRVEQDPNYRQHVQIAGIRLPHRARVTDFEEGLFVQPNDAAPSWSPPLEQVRRVIDEHRERITEIAQRELPADPEAALSIEQQILARKIRNALALQQDALMNLQRAMDAREKMDRLERELAEARDRNAPTEEIRGLEQSIVELREATRFEPPDYRIILGLGIPSLSFRTEQGETIRFLVPGHRVVLYVAPLGRGLSMKAIQPNVRAFTVIDDCHTDVSSIDTKLVYVPHRTLQVLNNMSPEYAADDSGEMVTPARTSQLHLKVSDPHLPEVALREVAAEVGVAWETFARRYRQLPAVMQPSVSEVMTETWRERQAHVVGPIESQRVLVIIILAIMSVVAVTLIFVILYTIVVQKTREIGVLKAVGASSWGVAGLFFRYGAIIGVVGAILGTVGGYLTVANINELQNWTKEQFNFVVFSPETHMFSHIPDTVDWSATLMILGGSIIAGLVGALLPAVRAARMQPAEAVRYE
jgi:ABC-type lipoprotein release transport system permease subunit